jgi:Protein of unknown function (DUF1161).
MKTHGVFVALALFAAPMLVHASCDAVKASIDAKLKAKGLEGYTLTVVAHDEPAGDGKVVGQCEGDKQIVYKKGTAASSPAEGGTAPAQPPARTDTKPAANKDSSGMPRKSDEPQPAVPSSSGG